MGDVLEVMFATGAASARCSRFADVTSTLGAGIVEINATIKTESGIGTYRKPHHGSSTTVASRKHRDHNLLSA